MQFQNYFFASIISFLGLSLGAILIKIAPEEQKPLGKYFMIYRQILLLLIFVFLIFYYRQSYYYLSTLIACFIFILFVEFKNKNLLGKSMRVYAILGVLFFLGLQDMNLFVVVSGLILLYGVPTASLIYSRKENNHSKLLLYNSGFLILANLLYAITTFRFLF